MSKIIDSLQKRFGTQSEVEALMSGSGAPQPQERPSRQQIHEQLADVYFQGPRQQQQQLISDEANPSFHAPTVVRVVDRSRSYFFPWVVTLLALALSVFTLFSSKRIAIDVRITDAAAPQTSAPAEPIYAVPAPAAVSRLAEAVSLAPSDFIFSGAALLRSSKERQQLVLTNSSVSGLAYAHAMFNPPFNALGTRLYFEARGMKGGEKFEIVLKDANGNTSLNWKPIIPFPDGLSSEWQPAVIDFEPTRFFDPSAIQQIRIEFGTQRTGNAADATLMIRNLQWAPSETDIE